MTKLRIAMDKDLIEGRRERIQSIAPDAELVAITPEGAVEGGGDGVTIWMRDRKLARIEAIGEQMPDLKWLHTTSAGVDHVLYAALVASDVIVTNSAGAQAIPIAESVMGMLVAIIKRFPDHWRNQQASQWERYRKDELYGKTLAIIGTGRIGREIAARARAFGLKTLAFTSAPREEPAFDQLLPYEAMEATLGEAHFVVMAAAMTPSRRGLMGTRQFAAMQPKAWFINIARGDLVDEAALMEALRSGQIAGAYLDVFTQEPLPADHPLWTMPNVLIIPHNTAYTWQSVARSEEFFYENLRRWVAGEPLVNVVDKKRGY